MDNTKAQSLGVCPSGRLSNHINNCVHNDNGFTVRAVTACHAMYARRQTKPHSSPTTVEETKAQKDSSDEVCTTGNRWVYVSSVGSSSGPQGESSATPIGGDLGSSSTPFWG